mmetsp:Transcript_52918/g.57447  ORF Transcript_52918/g.57447 Transcript_52918/m.57447 type:complete len:419 (+) Transcript_52918:28-1284(+)
MMLMSRSSSMTSLSNVILVIVGMLLFVAQVSMAMKEVRFASPLQSLTIPDPELFSESSTNNDNENNDENENGVSSMSRLLETPRKRFLPRFLAGLKAEDQVREGIAIGQVKVPTTDTDDHDFSGSDWVGKIKSIDERRKYQEDKVVGKAHDSAVELFEQKLRRNQKVKQENSNQYQIVGVINSSRRNNQKKQNRKNKTKGKGPISWYARPKPKNAKWTIRMIHVNKDAIIKDLFDRGKIDIFAKYTNTGRTSTTSDIDKQRQLEQKEEKLAQEGTSTSTKKKKEGLVPIVTTKYEARERSWKTLWNFSPKHFFTDPSGAYWRERRIHSHDSWWSSDRSSSGLGGTGGSRSSSGPTLYTDGDNVYESSYRYRDGRNGMHYVSTLQQFLVSSQTGITDKQKQQVLKKLQSKAPDIVVEEL